MNRYICIHGHFYQPPRENAWLDKIEIQESAHPFHDWNERITRECYETNGFSRILNENDKITDIVNNYARMSFNFGPTLLHWIESHHKGVYDAIIQADSLSMQYFNGHGSAMAQVYNHIIMPLASRRDKETQVKWGIYDFEYRFKRKPEGMWLAETAVDLETLEVLVENGILFTVLAPSQASRVRASESDSWEGFTDIRRPYICKLPSGKSISLFFYDGERSQGIAFKGLLDDGKRFASELTSGFDDRSEPQLMHVATDGETYGHHHNHGEMALAYCTRYLEENQLAKITNYSQFLSIAPPTYEVEIHENSSWSCAHGIERWKSDCGCHTGGGHDWNQKWRTPLREALDDLSIRFEAIYKEELSRYDIDPEELRNNYIELLVNRTPVKTLEFLTKYIPAKLSKKEITRIVRSLEMQKHAQFMFTSCGWFFNDVSGIETVQILQYANRAIQLAEGLTGEDLDSDFIRKLDDAKSNISSHGSGRDIYNKWVRTKQLTLTQVGMHYAVGSLFHSDTEVLQVLNYECISEDFKRYRAGIQMLAMGRTKVNSNITLSTKHFSFAILYLGNHHLIGNTSDSMTEHHFKLVADDIQKAFNNGKLSVTIDLIKRHFTDKGFSFYDLMLDEQMNMLNRVLETNIQVALSSYEKINDRTYSLMNVMKNNRLTIPPILIQNLETVNNYYIEDLLKRDINQFNLNDLEEKVQEVKRWDLRLNEEKIAFLATNRIHGLIESFDKDEPDDKLLTQIHNILDLMETISIKPAIHELQNYLFVLLLECRKEHAHCMLSLKKLAERVNMHVDSITAPNVILV